MSFDWSPRKRRGMAYEWTQGGTRIFHYHLKGHLIAETNQSGNMIAEYIYIKDQLLAMITKPGEMEIVSYFHNNHLGTPQILTNDSQAVVWKAAYTPFGAATISTQTVENPFRFPGQYYDPETGLHYNYYRYYDPTTGRYVTPDPIGLEGGINLWPYVAGNPLRWIDPWGLIWVTTGTSYSGYGVNNSLHSLLNRVTRLIGEGMDPSVAGSDPSEYLGWKRDTMQEWRKDPSNPCRDKEFPIGTIRKIPQTYQRSPYGDSEPSIVAPDSPSSEGYDWSPPVPDNTYKSYPGVTYPNLYFWRQGK